MPAKTTKKTKSKASVVSKKAVKKMPAKKMTSSAKVSFTEVEPFYSDPKNLMVIGAVIVLFLVVVMLLSGGAGMRY